MYKNVEDAYAVLKAVSECLDLMQSIKSTVADAVWAWKKLLDSFRERGMERREWLEFAEKRYKSSVPDSWFTACSLYWRELTGSKKISSKNTQTKKGKIFELSNSNGEDFEGNWGNRLEDGKTVPQFSWSRKNVFDNGLYPRRPSKPSWH